MCSEFGFGRRLNSWRVKVRPIVRVRTLSLPSLPVPLPSLPLPFPFFCHTYTSFPAHKTRTTGHDGVSLRTRQPGCSSRRRPTTHLLHQTKLSFFLFFSSFFPFQLEPLQDNGASLKRTQATPPPPSLTPRGTHAPVLCAFHSRFACTLPAAAPTTWLHYLDGFFLFSSFYIFNSNRRRTMAATTSPSPPRTRRRPRSLAPTHPRGAQAPAAAETVTAPTPSPERPPPALVAGPTPPQPPLPGLSHPQQPQPDPHPPENI